MSGEDRAESGALGEQLEIRAGWEDCCSVSSALCLRM